MLMEFCPLFGIAQCAAFPQEPCFPKLKTMLRLFNYTVKPVQVKNPVVKLCCVDM